ncbi:MAG: hypothetical protein ACRDGF_04650, partial [Chloroflexota bacterium]
MLAVNAGATALILAVGALLSAVQLLPTAELTSWSIRSGGLPYALATTFSLKGSMLFNALLPPFWNRDLLLTVPGGSEFMGYVSVIGLLLALAGVLYRRSRHTAFFCLLALFSLSLALGKQNPLFPAFYRFVPGFSSLRVPARWLFPYTLSLGALAGLGAEALLHERRRLNWRPFVLLLALLAIGGALLARLEVHPPLATVATWLAFAALALVLILGAMQPRAWRAPWGGLFAAALIVELWLGGQSLDYSHPVPSAVFSEQLPTLSFLERQPGPFRAVSVASDTFVPSIEAAFRQAHPNLSQEQTFNYLSYYKLREILEPNTSLAQGIATIDGYDGGLLPLARYVNFKNLLAGQPSDPDERLRFVIKWLPSRPLLDLANVRYVVMDSLSDKSDGSTVYDLSSFIHVDPSQPRATLQLAQPFAASSLGFVLALKGGDLPEGSTLATLTLHGANGSTQTVPVTEGSLRPFSTLPGPDKLPTLVGTASLPTPTTVQAVDVTLKAQGEEFYLNGLALISPGGVSLSPLVAPGGAFQRVFRGDVKIYRDEATLGAAFLVHNGQLAASPQAALAAISAPTFDPRRSVAIEANPQPPASGNLVGRILSRLRRLLPAAIGTPLPHSWFASPAPATNDTPDAVTVHEDSPERWSVSTRSAQAGFLVLSQSWFPGWTATVDGEPARLLAADELFQGV